MAPEGKFGAKRPRPCSRVTATEQHSYSARRRQESQQRSRRSTPTRSCAPGHGERAVASWRAQRAVTKLLAGVPRDSQADEDLQLRSPTAGSASIRSSRASRVREAIRRAGDELAEKFQLGTLQRQEQRPSSPRSCESRSWSPDEAAEAVAGSSPRSPRRGRRRNLPATSGQQSTGAYDGLAAEHRRQLAWGKLRGSGLVQLP